MDIYEQLRRDEGVRHFPYTDTKGKISAGVGRNLTDVGLSDQEIDLMFANDVALAKATLERRLPWYPNLDPVRQGVLQNMCFNLGFNGLEKFENMLIACAQGQWNEAADELTNSLWAKQVGDRAIRLAHQLVSGIWQ